MPPVTPTPADVEAATQCALELMEQVRVLGILGNVKLGCMVAHIAQHIAAARAEEREACAKVVELEKQLILDLARKNPMGLLTPREISCAYQSAGVLGRCLITIRARSEA